MTVSIRDTTRWRIHSAAGGSAIAVITVHRRGAVTLSNLNPSNP
jgi:hypothetical protein